MGGHFINHRIIEMGVFFIGKYHRNSTLLKYLSMSVCMGKSAKHFETDDGILSPAFQFLLNFLLNNRPLMVSLWNFHSSGISQPRLVTAAGIWSKPNSGEWSRIRSYFFFVKTNYILWQLNVAGWKVTIKMEVFFLFFAEKIIELLRISPWTVHHSTPIISPVILYTKL